MKKVVRVSEAEMEVMEKLWDQEGAIKQSQLLVLFEEDGKEWKRQTLNTFLSRLEDKGLVKRENRLVKPLYSREEYANIQVKAVINRIYGGKLSNFMVAFVKENVSEKLGTVEELREAMEKQTRKTPYMYGDGYADGVMVYDMYECPGCGKSYEIDGEKYDFCPNCGQAMDWSEENE